MAHSERSKRLYKMKRDVKIGDSPARLGVAVVYERGAYGVMHCVSTRSEVVESGYEHGLNFLTAYKKARKIVASYAQ